MNRVMLLIAMLVVAPMALAQPSDCTMGGLTRSVEVVQADPPNAVPCEVIYAKPDEGEVRASLWSAQSETGYCEARAAELIEKLQGMGWTCTSAPATDTSVPDTE